MEKRNEVRKKKRFKVSWFTEKTSSIGFTEDISLHGMAILSRVEPLSRHIKIILNCDGDEECFTGICRFKRIVRKSGAKLFQIGVYFKKVPETYIKMFK